MLANLQSSQTAIGDRPYKNELSVAAAGPYHNNLEPFLGPPTKSIDHNPSDQFPHEAWFLPDAYQGELHRVARATHSPPVDQVATITSERRSCKR